MSSDDRSILHLFKGGSTDFLGTLGSFMILYIAKAILTRYLDIASFGTVALGMTILTILSTVSLLGLKTGLTRFIPRYENDAQKRDVALTGLGLGFVFSLISASTLFFAAPLLSTVLDGSNIADVLRVFAVTLPLYAVLRLSIGVTLGYERVTPKVLANQIALPITRLGAVATVIILGLGPVAAAWGYAASFGVAALIAAIFLVRTCNLRIREAFEPNPRELLAFSAPLAISGAVSMVLSDIDAVLLGSLATASAVGLYEVAYSLGNLFTLVVSSLGTIFVPMMSRLHSERAFDEMQKTYLKSNKWTAAITIPPLLVTLTYPSEIISFTFGAKYATASATLMVLALGFSGHAVLGPNGGFLTSIGATREVLYSNIFVAAVNLILNLAWIPSYGTLGAAVATTVSYVILNIIYQVVIHQRTKIVPFNKEVGQAIGVALLSYIPVLLIFEVVTSPSASSVLLFSGVYAVVCAVAQIRAGFITESEQPIVESIGDRLGIPAVKIVHKIEP